MKKEYRIKKNQEIESILNEKKSVASNHFVIYVRENHENTHFKYAISVPKKFGNAVERNLMKRRVRSIIRESNISDNYDFFVVVKKQANILTFVEIKKELLSLFIKTKLEADNE